ncbi:MAG TPA: M20/M25/M40 family metallo-hydrolase, partial [Caldithrix abyssi]|nr:M20/M25/M40 family metallo-hydrolase [Caldithrix abyssi]
MSKEPFDRLSAYISAREEEAIHIMKALVSIKALGPLNGGTGEAEKGAWLTDYLKKSGFSDVKNYPAPDPSVPAGERPNIVARIPGKRTDKSIWIMSHMDVVPEGDLEKWETPPYEAVVKEGKIFGRGTEDNHQGLVASLIAAKAFIDLNIVPEYNLNLVFVSDEETNSIYGLEYLVEHHADLFRKEDIYIIPDAGEPDSTMIEIAEKSILWLRFVTKGKQVHASTP